MTNLPQQIANYRLEKRIGKGGSSEVWLARHHSLPDRQVAIKLLMSQSAEWIERFSREANITSRLRHDHIIQIYDHGHHPPFYYTVMEYVAGSSLREVLKGGHQLPLEQALVVFRHAGEALDYAHANGVIHRDVSPGNILIEQSSGRVLLTDFGIARESGKTGFTSINNVMGTPGYLSPEHASSATAVTHLSDLYSLGVVLFEMLTGRLPWDHNPGMLDGTGGPFDPPKSLANCGVRNLPPEVDRVMQTLLAVDQSKRFPSARAAIDALERALNRHTSPTQVVRGSAERARGATPASGSPLLAQPLAELHPVETLLSHDLLKAPVSEAHKRAERLRQPEELTALLDQWSQQHWLHRPAMGRQAVVHRVTSSNIYFYTLRVQYERRETPVTTEVPDYQTISPPLEREVDRWNVKLPDPVDFADEAGGRIALPGTLRVVQCATCKGVGKTECPRCKGKRRIKREEAAPAPAASTSKPVPARAPVAAPVAAKTKVGATTTLTAPPAAPAPGNLPALVPCPECSGTGGFKCDICDGQSRLVQEKTTTWRRWPATFLSHDPLGKADETWLLKNCKPVDVYRERQMGDFRSEWLGVPELADLIEQSTRNIDGDTRIVMSEVSIRFIPMTEIIFDFSRSKQPIVIGQAQPNGDAQPAGEDTLYDWYIYGFENRLPQDWRYFNLDRALAVILGVLALVVSVLLAFALFWRFA